MLSASILERSGRWRWVGVFSIVSLALLPHASLLLLRSEAGVSNGSIDGFTTALLVSSGIAVAVSGIAFLLGWPLGVLLSLYRFSGRRFVVLLSALPLLAPSFLWAIGWSALAAKLSWIQLQGPGACVLVLTSQALPLVILGTWAAASSLTASQRDAAQMAGGRRMLFAVAARSVALPALLLAALSGVLTLSDSGPGFVFGVQTAAGEILTSFAATNDHNLAMRQCSQLVGIVLLAALPLIILGGRRLAAAGSSQQISPPRGRNDPLMGRMAFAALALVILFGTLAPLAGLVGNLSGNDGLDFALSQAHRTVGNTLIYGLGAGLVSIFLGLALALCAGRSPRLGRVVIAACLLLLCLPPATAALGTAAASAEAPPWTDPLLRGRAIVCLILGLRSLSITTLLMMRAWGSTPRSWAEAAGLSGVSLGRFFIRIALPQLRAAMGAGCVLVALLSIGDVGTVLLLAPPGESSYPLSLFTVMANAPETTVSWMCVILVAASATGLGVLGYASTRPRH